MAIYAFTGVPGSGKSAHAAREIRDALNNVHQKPVIANFPLAKNAPVKYPENFLYLPNNELTTDAIQGFADDYWLSGRHKFKEDFITLVIDECQILFNSRSWSQRGRMSYLEFLSQSRKYGVKVILIAQNLKMIDNQFRMLVDMEHNHRRIQSMGVPGWVFNKLCGGHVFLDVTYVCPATQGKERLSASLFWPNRKDFAMYDSYALFRQREDDN